MHLVSEVYKRRAGSAVRKAVLAYLADRASDDGSGIWCSKRTIAAETEVSLGAVKTTIKAFLEEGLLHETGHRPCRNGYTVEYALDVAAVMSLPLRESTRSGVTRSNSDGVKSDRVKSDRVTGEPPRGSPHDPHGGHPMTPNLPRTTHRTTAVLKGRARESDQTGDGGGFLSLNLEEKGEGIGPRIEAAGMARASPGDARCMARWDQSGIPRDVQVAVIGATMETKKEPGPPSSMAYFNNAMGREMARRSGSVDRGTASERAELALNAAATLIQTGLRAVCGHISDDKARELVHREMVTEEQCRKVGLL